MLVESTLLQDETYYQQRLLGIEISEHCTSFAILVETTSTVSTDGRGVVFVCVLWLGRLYSPLDS